MAVSCTGQSAVPHCGHGKRPPLAKSISISRRRFWASKAQALTIHGGISPRANCIRSVSRIEVSPAVLLSLDPAAVLAPVKEWPGDVENVSSSACRPSLTAAARERLGGTAGRGGGMVLRSNRGMEPKHWHQAAPVTSPTLNSEEANKGYLVGRNPQTGEEYKVQT